MQYKQILITGGAGFVGSNLAVKLKEYFIGLNVTVLDNLMRRGSELNLPKLKKSGVKFLHGDIRNQEDINGLKMDLLIECSAEPSVMAGITSSPEYLLHTNLFGAVNCFEMARKCQADVVFLSTSRVYPISYLNDLKIKESVTRYVLEKQQTITGASDKGINEDFPLNAPRSLYGTTKLAAEYLLQEYVDTYQINAIINRCGLITGPWQMGKVDQGVVVLWLAAHLYHRKLAYIGYGGKGKQVRDILDVDDLFNLLLIQLKNIKKYNGQVFNAGGGNKGSLSLLELTNKCQEITGKKILIDEIKETRKADIKLYISDNSKITKLSGWEPKKPIDMTLKEIFNWLLVNKSQLEPILAP